MLMPLAIRLQSAGLMAVCLRGGCFGFSLVAATADHEALIAHSCAAKHINS